mmetsp:Transcript_47097/g.150957  ORF Transcript_47097/g.150957 Transcript_47097/m.150957 type:complete len:201 (-) Transcript_47097:379-981(-)
MAHPPRAHLGELEPAAAPAYFAAHRQHGEGLLPLAPAPEVPAGGPLLLAAAFFCRSPRGQRATRRPRPRMPRRRYGSRSGAPYASWPHAPRGRPPCWAWRSSSRRARSGPHGLARPAWRPCTPAARPSPPRPRRPWPSRARRAGREPWSRCDGTSSKGPWACRGSPAPRRSSRARSGARPSRGARCAPRGWLPAGPPTPC